MQRTIGIEALGEIASALQRGGQVELGRVGRPIVVVLNAEEEECFVLTVVELGNGDVAAEAAAPSGIRLVRNRNTSFVAKKVIGVHGGATDVTIQAAMIIVGAGFHEGVKHTATGARHFGVVGVGLNFDFLDGFQSGDDDRAIVGIGDWNTIEQIVIAADRAAGDGNHG